ncbi:MAG: PQQ-like beta-propeller repeat protein [Armatimonadetes bacterium]|nr:PQQ-like beta-propeller repeat protein [Armatimonadota bacterium]
MKLLAVSAMLALSPLCLAQGQTLTLHACDDLQGITPQVSANLPETKLEIVNDPAQVVEGTGCLHAASVSPAGAEGNTYLSVVFTTPPTDTTGKALVLEAWSSTPDKSLAFYVRGYDAQGTCVLSWLSWAGLLSAKPRTFTLVPGMLNDGMAWEPGMVRSADRTAVVKWEVYTGTHDHGVAYDLYLDHLRLEPNTMRSFLDITEAHELTPDTVLVAEGRPAGVILTPATPEWAAAGHDLAGAIEQATGARLEVRAGDAVSNEDLASTHAVLLGNVANNRAFLYPYTHDQTYADGVFPGAGGYELRTAQDPFGTGHNLITIGASDLTGLRAGVEALSANVKPGATLTLPRLCEVKLGGEAERLWGSLFTQDLGEAWVKGQQDAAEKTLAEGGHTGLFSQMATVGENYALTGRAPYAEMFVWLAKRAYAHYQTNPGTFGGPWGMDADFPSHRVVPAWDVVEECPSLTAADRLEVSRILFQYITEAALPEASGAAGAAQAGRLVSNHGTFAALGAFCAGEFFAKHYDAAEGKQWMTLGDQTFSALATGSKVHEDCNGYQWLTQYHIIRYALTKPDLTYFENGNARRAADFAILTMNNLGYQVPYGDTGAWICWFSELPVLRACEWFYRDGRYQWAINKKLALGQRLALGQLDPQGPTTAPDDLIGARAWALDAKYFGEAGEGAPPVEATVDKVAFRDSFDPQGQYLLLDGLSNGGHRHMDGNSVLQWTERERVWLADADYIKSLPKYHNGVLILKDGQSASIPDYCELERFADLPGLAASITTLRNYAGVDWRRHVFWLKGQAFVIADQMVAREAGDYSFRAVWQTVGEVEVNDNGLDINQKGQHARFAMTPDARCLLNDDPQTGANWSTYPHAEDPVVRVFQGVFNQRLQPGQRFTLFTVLHASGEQPSPVRVTRVNSNRAVVTGLGEPFMVSLPDDDGRMQMAEEVEVQASAVVATPQKGYLVGLSQLPGELAFPLPADGVDVELDIGLGSAFVKLPGPTRTTPAAEGMNINIGAAYSAADVRDFIAMAQQTAAPAVATGPVAPEAPALKELWSYRDRLAAYLLTNNGGVFEAVDAGLKLTCSPQPLAENVFGSGNTNTLDNLVDGQFLTTDGGVMWDTDQEVTIDLTFDNEYQVSRLDLKAWFATSSSKNKLYQLGRLRVLASSDGFQADSRVLVDSTDAETHGNWGAPGHAPHLYSFSDLQATARALRLILTPRPGTGIYLSELQVWGTRPGLEIDVAARLREGLPVHTFTCLAAADLTGDGQDEVLAGSTNGALYCFTGAGDLLWKYEGGARVNCVGVVDFRGDGRPSVVVGVHDARLVALNAAGEELWTFRPPYYKRAGHPRTVFPADLAGDGRQVAVVGAENWHYYAVDADGQMIWKYESVHGSTAGTAADLDGDRKDEVVAGTEYYWWHVINSDGTRRFGYSTRGGPCANAVAAGDLDGDGQREVLFGGADTLIHVLGADGALRWTFNTGDEVQALQCADVNGDGKDEVLAASLSFNVYCLDGSGRPLWRQDLGDQVRCLTAMQSAGQWLVAAGCDSNHIVVMDGKTGVPVAMLDTGSRVLKLSAATLAGGAGLVAATGDGNLRALSLP